MEAPVSPAPSTLDFVSEDDWDLISNKSDPGVLSTAPPSTLGDYESDVGGAHHADDLNDQASEISANDDIDSADEASADGDAVLHESDRRVSEALANPLSSTLEPFREPLPEYISDSVSSSASSALVLSFPDPLTPSQEFEHGPEIPNTEVEQAPHGRLSGDIQDLPDSLVEVPARTEAAVETAQLPSVTPVPPADTTEEGPAPAPVVEQVIVSRRDASDLRRIASYASRKKGMEERRARRLAKGFVSSVFQGPLVPHSWATSIAVGILAIVLGSAFYASGSQWATSIRPAQTPLTPAAGILPITKSLCGRPATSASPSPNSRILDIPLTSLQTPGAGPSTHSTAGQRGQSSTVGKEIVKDLASVSLSNVATSSTASTRSGSATPFPARSGFWSKGKGKEKEVVDLPAHEEALEAEETESRHDTLLLDGPASSLNLGYFCRDVLKGFKAALNEGRSPFIKDLINLSTFNFDEMLDELISRIIFKTSSILQDLSAVVGTAEAVLTTHAEAFLSHRHVQYAKDTIVKHHSRVSHNFKKISKTVRAHHKRVRANARKGLKAPPFADLHSIVDTAKAHHDRVMENTKKGRQMMEEGLRAVVDGGQRFLADAFGPNMESLHEEVQED